MSFCPFGQHSSEVCGTGTLIECWKGNKAFCMIRMENCPGEVCERKGVFGYPTPEEIADCECQYANNWLEWCIENQPGNVELAKSAVAHYCDRIVPDPDTGEAAVYLDILKKIKELVKDIN